MMSVGQGTQERMSKHGMNLDGNRVSLLQHRLQNWREVIIRADSLLGWEKDWYPTITTGVLTTVFCLVWFLDPTLLTLTSLVGLLVTVADYVGPMIANQMFGANWNDAKEMKYREVCANILLAIGNVESAICSHQQARRRRPVFYFFSTVASLLALAWLGNRVNNFFLAYLFTLAVAMLPGLYRRGLIQKCYAQLSWKVAEMIKGKEAMKKSE